MDTIRLACSALRCRQTKPRVQTSRSNPQPKSWVVSRRRQPPAWSAARSQATSTQSTRKRFRVIKDQQVARKHSTAKIASSDRYPALFEASAAEAAMAHKAL